MLSTINISIISFLLPLLIGTYKIDLAENISYRLVLKTELCSEESFSSFYKAAHINGDSSVVSFYLYEQIIAHSTTLCNNAFGTRLYMQYNLTKSENGFELKQEDCNELKAINQGISHLIESDSITQEMKSWIDYPIRYSVNSKGFLKFTADRDTERDPKSWCIQVYDSDNNLVWEKPKNIFPSVELLLDRFILADIDHDSIDEIIVIGRDTERTYINLFDNVN